jgi:hypothetical protein
MFQRFGERVVDSEVIQIAARTDRYREVGFAPANFRVARDSGVFAR